MRALDFVLTPNGSTAIIKETVDNGERANIKYINPNATDYKCAWWNSSELVVINSLPNILSQCIAHQFGRGSKDVDKFFGINAAPEALQESKNET